MTYADRYCLRHMLSSRVVPRPPLLPLSGVAAQLHLGGLRSQGKIPRSPRCHGADKLIPLEGENVWGLTTFGSVR